MDGVDECVGMVDGRTATTPHVWPLSSHQQAVLMLLLAAMGGGLDGWMVVAGAGCLSPLPSGDDDAARPGRSSEGPGWQRRASQGLAPRLPHEALFCVCGLWPVVGYVACIVWSKAAHLIVIVIHAGIFHASSMAAPSMANPPGVFFSPNATSKWCHTLARRGTRPWTCLPPLSSLLPPSTHSSFFPQLPPTKYSTPRP